MELEKKSKSELVDICRQLKLKGFSNKSKLQLIDMIQAKSEVEVKPFLKWVGGKTQIIEQVISSFPIEMNNYYEPFLGGGSVLLALLHNVNKGSIKINGNIYASDANQNLINLYKNIQSRCDDVMEELKKIIEEFNSCREDGVNREPNTIQEATASKESYYYWIRKRYNQLGKSDTVMCSAMFIFLNKTCFRGMYREGPNGFNVPYGNYKNPSVFDETQLRETSKLIKNVTFSSYSFTEALKLVHEKDFVYLDPPYAPENLKSFVGYTSEGFKIENHKELFKLTNELRNKNINLLMSNADVEMVKEAFSSSNYNIKSILCKRAINSKNPNAMTNELLIKSY
jgi:DNA adenine methylase